MMLLFKPKIQFLEEHSVDPDKRRYALPDEAARHYIDLDQYGIYPYDSLPRNWNEARIKFSEDSLRAHGIVPWWIQTMMQRLTNAFKEKNQVKILKYAAEIGHYIADAHVPLHTTRNHNGQLTGQKGIHGFWESRIPELLANNEWDFIIGKADYLPKPAAFIWARVLESAAAVDTVLGLERALTEKFSTDQKYAFEERNEVILRQYSESFSRKYDQALKGMIERRMRLAIYSVASFWYTAWINAGQPDLQKLSNKELSQEEQREFEVLNLAWKNQGQDRDHE